jgi:DNA-binding transcriptional ArsR family regulator/uncharacterized protein YndB with AHSA1/START domain
VLDDSVQGLLDALASPVRREILWLVWDRELAAGDIVGRFDLGAPTISGHLKVLRDAGLVMVRTDGTFRRYRAAQDRVAGLRRFLREDEHKWFPGSTPAPMAPARGSAVVIVETDAECDQATAFRAFTDPALYSRWSGVPVTLVDGHFMAEMEWGLQVRGTYDYLLEPSLIVMRWDFEPAQVPVPGAGQRAYLEITPRAAGCHLELHQLVRAPEHVAYMERAWGMMLARFRDGVQLAVDAATEVPLRPKRRRSTPHG